MYTIKHKVKFMISGGKLYEVKTYNECADCMPKIFVTCKYKLLPEESEALVF